MDPLLLQAIAAIGGLIAAFGALATAYFTWRIAQANRESANAARKASEAALAQIRHAGPLLAPTVGMDDVHRTSGWVRIALRNVGSSPAFNIRCEVEFDGVELEAVDPGIGDRRSSIEVGEIVDDKRRMAFKYPDFGMKVGFLGKVRVRYYDAEQREFTTRLSIKVERGEDPGQRRAIHEGLTFERPQDLPT